MVPRQAPVRELDADGSKADNPHVAVAPDVARESGQQRGGIKPVRRGLPRSARDLAARRGDDETGNPDCC